MHITTKHAPGQHTRLSRRRFLVAAGGSAATAILAACGGESSPTAAPAAPTRAALPPATTAPTPATPAATAGTARPALIPTAGAAMPTAGAMATALPVVDGQIPSGSPDVPDAYAKLPQPFKAIPTIPGKGGKVTTFHIAYAPPPPPRDQNRYWQELEKRLGVTLEPIFAPAGMQYDEKFAALTAGGELPDLMLLVAPPGLQRVLTQGAFTDLTPYLTGDALKEFPNLAAISPRLWKNVAFRGKMYGVPRSRRLVNSTLIYRQDWVDTLGLSLPKNADEFFGMMVAFRRNDPDGNGKEDTYGGADFIVRMLNSLFRVPNGWRLNPDGTLTNQIETEEYRQAVAFGRRLWEAGVLMPDAPSIMQSNAKLKDAFTSGKAGVMFENVSTTVGAGTREDAQKVNPAANPRALVPPGHDGGKAVMHNGTGFFGYTAIPAKVGRDRERVKELLRVLDYYAAPFGSEEWRFLNYGIAGIHHEIRNGEPQTTALGRAERSDLNNLSSPPEAFFYTRPGEAEYIQRVTRDLVAIGIDNPVEGAYSPTGATKAVELSRLNEDRFISIVTGREPLSAMDGWVRDWRSRGGDMIRKELEEARKEQ